MVTICAAPPSWPKPRPILILHRSLSPPGSEPSYRFGSVPSFLSGPPRNILNECLTATWPWLRPNPCCGQWHVGENNDGAKGGDSFGTATRPSSRFAEFVSTSCLSHMLAGRPLVDACPWRSRNLLPQCPRRGHRRSLWVRCQSAGRSWGRCRGPRLARERGLPHVCRFSSVSCLGFACTRPELLVMARPSVFDDESSRTSSTGVLVAGPKAGFSMGRSSRSHLVEVVRPRGTALGAGARQVDLPRHRAGEAVVVADGALCTRGGVRQPTGASQERPSFFWGATMGCTSAEGGGHAAGSGVSRRVSRSGGLGDARTNRFTANLAMASTTPCPSTPPPLCACHPGRSHKDNELGMPTRIVMPVSL